ncbi:MAG: ABC transporter permease [Ottowia sp.]|nr:ABC transporter permease [Ottowia sp.]
MIDYLYTLIKELCTKRDVLWQLVRQQLILRYRRTTLGYLWTLINPLLMMSVTAVVFATLFKVELKDYAVFLFAGMIPWNCFNATIGQSAVSFINNEGLIKKIYLPKIFFPLSVALAVLIDSMLSFFVLFAIILCIGGQLSWSLLFIPFAYVLLFFFSFGVALVASVATVFFRDLQYVIVIAMQAWFFLTPIMYKKNALTGSIAWLVQFNPVSTFIELFRNPLCFALLPSPSVIASAAALAIISLAFGLLVLARQEEKIVFRL